MEKSQITGHKSIEKIRRHLNGCAGQENSSFCFQTHESLIRLILRIFESVSFITKDKSDLTLVKDRGVETERFIRQNLKFKMLAS